MNDSENSNKIGIMTATIVGMNAMIGSGIFTIPAALAFYVGPAGILTTIFVALAVWFMAVSIARVASLFPEEGSFYIYSKQWGGHTMGLISAGAYLFGLLIALGFLAQIASVYLKSYFPNISEFTLGLCVLLTVFILNMIGMVISKVGQYIIICTTLFPLFATIILCIPKINFNYLNPFAPHGWINVFKSTKDVIFSFFGFEATASLFSIVKNPDKNVPKALTFSITIVSIIYIFFITSLLLSVPSELFTNPKLPITDVLHKLFPQSNWITAIHLSIISAITGVINAMVWSSSRLLLSLTKRMKNNYVNYLVKSNIINPKTAIILIGIPILVSYTLLKDANLFFSLTALFIVFAYITSMITLLTIKDEWKSGQNIKTIIGLITASFIFIFAFQDLVMEITKLIK